MKTQTSFNRISRMVLTLLVLNMLPIQAADIYWTNIAGGNYGDAVNWDNGVPTSADTALFVSNNSYLVNWATPTSVDSAYFNNGTVTQSISPNSWTVNNQYVVGGTSGQTGTVIHTTGSLFVTNASGTALMSIGEIGRGTYRLNGGNLTVDYLLSTNNVPFSHSNSFFTFNNGNMTTLNGSHIKLSTNDQFVIGQTPGVSTWTMTGGTNIIEKTSVGTRTVYLGNQASVTTKVTVLGEGTVWSNTAALLVGNYGSGSRLDISNGAYVFSASDTVYIGNQNTAYDNKVTVAGTGSTWSNTTAIYVGNLGKSNILEVKEGGMVSSIGILSGGSGHGNTVLITDSGSRMTANGNLYISQSSGTNNSIIVSNGGNLYNNGAGYLGYGTGAVDNKMIVTGTGSTWSNALLYVGGSGSETKMIITNGGKVYSIQGYNNSGIIGNNINSRSNSVVIDGTGSEWNNNADVTIGAGTSDNSIIVTNGGLLKTRRLIVGANSGGSNNTILLTGSGSIVTNMGGTYLGYNPGSSNNSIRVEKGGSYYDATLSIGYTNDLSGSVMIITDAGTTYRNTGSQIIGESGKSNSLIISNGAFSSGINTYIGYNATATDNNVKVTDSGSMWSNSGSMIVGRAGHGNRLLIENQGYVMATSSGIGQQSTGSNNNITVTGSGSILSNSGTLTIGTDGAGNLLTVSDSGKVYSGTGISSLGSSTGGSNNSVLITGSGSEWNIGQDFYVGNGGRNNQLIISNQGAINVKLGSVLGNATSSVGNIVKVTGAGSVWTNGNMQIGGSGAQNSLYIENGGSVTGAQILIGANTPSSNNFVSITGSGSKLTAYNNNLRLGAGGDYNILNVSNGGALAVDNFLTVGFAGSSNQLNVVNGSQVKANSSIILGDVNTAKGNSLYVSDSIVTTPVAITVGNFGSGNTITVENQGKVFSSSGTIGSAASSSNNGVTVSGSGSVWSNSGSLTISASGGTGNKLAVSNGGTVYANGGINVNTNGLLEGSGLIVGNTTVSSNGMINPNGKLTNNGNVNIQSGGLFEADMDFSDAMSIAGNLTNNGSMLISGDDANVLGAFGLELSGNLENYGSMIWELDAVPAIGHYGGFRSLNSFSLTGISLGGAATGMQLSTIQTGGFYYLTVVPEPSTYAMLLIGAGLMIGVIRRHRTKTASCVNAVGRA